MYEYTINQKASTERFMSRMNTEVRNPKNEIQKPVAPMQKQVETMSNF